MKLFAFLALAAAGVVAASGLAAPTTTYDCVGSEVVLFNNTNGFSIGSGGTPPTFSTNGKAYCLTYLEHYHWNNGKGGAPGKIGLKGPTTAGPFQALTSAGQGGAQNVNHYVYVSRTPPVVIQGSYSCTDTAAATWSANTQSGGRGFCIVKGVPAVAGGGSTQSSPTTTTTTTVAGTQDLEVEFVDSTANAHLARNSTKEAVVYEVKVTNHGPHNAAHVTLNFHQEYLNEWFPFDASGACEGHAAAAGGGEIECTFALARGAARTLHVVFHLARKYNVNGYKVMEQRSSTKVHMHAKATAGDKDSPDHYPNRDSFVTTVYNH